MKQMPRESWRMGHLLIVAIFCGLFFAVTRKFLLPVGLGLLFSMLFQPLYHRMLRIFRQRTGTAAAVTTLLLTVFMVLPMSLAGSVIVRDTTQLIQSMTQSIQGHQLGDLHILDIPLISNVYQKLNTWIGISEQEFLNRGKQVGTAIVSFLTAFLGGLATSLPGKLLAIVFFLIAFYYGLKDGRRFTDYVRKLLPYSEQETDDLFSTVEGISKGVIFGALAAGTVQGIIIGLGYWIFGLPRPFFFGALTLIFSFIPLFGSLPTGLGGVIYLLIQQHYAGAVGMGIAFVLASVSDNVVKPWVLKEHAELHPLVGLISVLGGVGLFGFAGIFFGPIVAALTIAVLQMKKTPQAETVAP